MDAVQDLVSGIRQIEQVVITTKNGALRGRYLPYKSGTGSGYYAFQGIRYGKAPTGARRFRAALPETKWKGIKKAVREGQSCPHRNMILENFKGNEDCLFLNIYTPKLPGVNGNPKLPILFWIHGGAFQFGNGNAFLYGPDYLLPENIMVVTINYRLGALGFLNAGTPDAPGNAGLKDQVLALRWVRDNIEAFGGDPDEVVIGGQSAGSASVHYLMMSPSAKGLFKRAILQSGVTTNPWAVTNIPNERAFMLGKALNFHTNDTEKLIRKLISGLFDNWTIDILIISLFLYYLLEFLRRVSPQQIVDASPKTLTEVDASNNVGLPFVPSLETAYDTINNTDEYDEPFLTEDPKILLHEGRFNRVPLMIGFNANEAMLFIRSKI